MRALLALVAVGLLLVTVPQPALAHHQDAFQGKGLAVKGAEALQLAVQFLPSGGSAGDVGTFHLTLTDATGVVVHDDAFAGAYTQNGLDRDPIPEAFVRHGFSVNPAYAFDFTGAFAQWEQNPLLFVHAYEGTYQGYTISFVVLRVGNTYL